MDTFEDNNALVLHQRAEEPCALREWVVLEGCSEEQKEKIRKGDKVCFRVLPVHASLLLREHF